MIPETNTQITKSWKRADGMPIGLARMVPHHVTRMKVTKSIAPKP